jgi:AraC-like DNA-binding protein
MIGLASLLGHVVALDRDLVLNFVRDCQSIAGRFPGIPPQDLVALLRRFALLVPSTSTLSGQVVVQLLALDIVSRARAVVPGWRAEWETEFTFRLGSEPPTGAVIKRAIEQVANRISQAQQVDGAATAPTTTATQPPLKVEAALEVVRQRYNEPGLGLRAVARHVLLTPSHLDRLLTRHTGYSFVHHLRRARLEAAQRSLCSPVLSIKEVAAEAGYNSVTHLDRDFRKHIGCSPSNWRRQYNRSAAITLTPKMGD